MAKFSVREEGACDVSTHYTLMLVTGQLTTNTGENGKVVRKVHKIFLFYSHLNLFIFYIQFNCFIYQACSASLAKLLLYLLLLIPPRLALFLRRQLPSISCMLSDALFLSNGLFGTHGRNIAPCGTIYRVSMGATVFWVCRKWNNK